MMRFNPPPGWPAPPPGWQPPADWRPDPAWPPAPPNWSFWVEEAAVEPQILLQKLANLLVEDATVDLRRTAGASASVIEAPMSSLEVVLDGFRAKYGGLWVGGTLTVTDQQVEFRANALNRAVQAGTLDIAVPLGAIAHVEVQPGFVTKIVAITVGHRQVKSRMYGADQVVETLRQAVGRARGLS